MKENQEDTYTMHDQKYENYAAAIPNKFVVDKNLSDFEFRVMTFILSKRPYKKVDIQYLSEKLNMDVKKLEEVVNNLIEKSYLEKDFF